MIYLYVHIIQHISNRAVHKNNSVSGRPAGWLKKVRLETFFFLLFFSSKIGQYFHWKKKIVAARLASILATRWTGNIFFMDSPVFEIKGAPCNLSAGCTHFGTCAPCECTLFQNISVHYTVLNTREIPLVHGFWSLCTGCVNKCLISNTA